MDGNTAEIKNHPGFIAFWGSENTGGKTQTSDTSEAKKELAEDNKYGNK